mgnify:FL=1
MDMRAVYDSYIERGYDAGLARLLARKCEMVVDLLREENAMIMCQLYDLTHDHAYYVPGTYEEHKKGFEEKSLMLAGMSAAIRAVNNGPVKKSDAERAQYEELHGLNVELQSRLNKLKGWE